MRSHLAKSSEIAQCKALAFAASKVQRHTL
jgi:hypothetical protein